MRQNKCYLLKIRRKHSNHKQIRNLKLEMANESAMCCLNYNCFQDARSFDTFIMLLPNLSTERAFGN